MTRQELQELYLSNEYGTFKPLYTYEDYIVELDELTGKIISETYIGLVILKTAQEAYEEWLSDKDNPPEQRPTDAELLQNEILILTEQNVDLDFRVLMLEFNLA